MRNTNCNVWNKCTAHLPVCLTILLVFLISGCATVPKLTAEDRKMDIQFMADWARDNNPFVELAQEQKGTPSYEELLPKYLEYAEQARSNEEFYRVVLEYLRLINPAGHTGLIPEGYLKIFRLPALLGMNYFDLSTSSIRKGIYWPRFLYGMNLQVYAHPPFAITYEDDKYFTNNIWEAGGVLVPKGSQIIRVNGMNCSAFLEYLNENTPLRYSAFPKDWIKNYLLIIDEGESFKGWQVNFLLPDRSTHSAFVPAIKGFPFSKKKLIQTIEANENCTCIELTDEVAYIRVKLMWTSEWAALFKSFLEKDGKIIKTFFDNANGKYSKLIIDVRRNGGGIPYYWVENLLRPFLDESVTFDKVTGLKRKYRDNLTDWFLKTSRTVGELKKDHSVSMEEIDAPEGFDAKNWVFYRVKTRIEPNEPRDRYNFDGSIYVLIDKPTFSSADSYANAVKQIGFAKLVGRNTGGGGGAYITPPILRLPASGMLFRVQTELLINPDGSINGLFGTPPDVMLEPADPPKSITKDDLLQDEWIKWILADSQG